MHWASFKIISDFQYLPELLWLLQSSLSVGFVGCGLSPPHFNVTQGGSIGTVARTGSDITPKRSGSLPTYEPCACWIEVQTTLRRQPDYLSLPLTHSLMLVCVCMRKSVCMCLWIHIVKYVEKEPSAVRARDKHEKENNLWADWLIAVSHADQGLSRDRCGLQQHFWLEAHG